MKNTKQHPRAAGPIAAFFGKFKKSYAITATATWQDDGLWIEGMFGIDQFEALIEHNELDELVVNYAATWFSERKTEDADHPYGVYLGCGYEFNSELHHEYEIKFCPNCGREIDD
ncbi:MAG: hypothetical protein FWH26_07375 [Oscillospiraceae bacterium]|nr:hypothetical protein [Oscillospiraceae bacterium]